MSLRACACTRAYTAGMSVASTPTKLPLATFAKILGMHPLHFEGVQFTPEDRSANLCAEALMQYGWQESDRVAREDIAIAIQQAEQMLEEYLGFRLIPSWEADEWHQAARASQPETVGFTPVDIRGHASTVKASWGYIRSGGVEAKTSLGGSRPIVWSDEDGDNLKETATVTVTNVAAAVEACQVEVYYPGYEGDPAWQIRPALVEKSGSTLTITFRRELAVIEDILFSMNNPRPADYTIDAHFLDAVDVYWHYNDPATQATLMWDPQGCLNCAGGGCSLCAYTVQTGCLHLRSTPKQGILGWSPGVYNANTNGFDSEGLSLGRAPDLVRLYYYAGWMATRGCPRVMDPRWAQAVTYLAVSLMDRPLCDCSANVWRQWQTDLTLLSGSDTDQQATFSFGSRELAAGCPFGTKRGAVWAWQRVKDQDVARVNSAVLV